MLTTRSVVSIFSIAMMILGAGLVLSQEYPTKPIRIFTGGAGGGNDVTSRILAEGISGPLGQPIIIENRAFFVATEAVAKAAPDGYSIQVVGASLWTYPLFNKVNYDVLRDFAPITAISRDVFVLSVHPAFPVKSVKELIALAKAKPGQIDFATAGTGGVPHLAGELFNIMAGVKMVAVNYKGSPQIAAALLSGEVQLTFSDVNLQAPHVKTGKLRALAVTSVTPSALVPGLPTIAASGVPGYEAIGMTVFLTTAKTSAAIVNRLNQEAVRFLNRPEIKEKFLNIGTEIGTSTPEQLAQTIKSDITKWGKVIKDAGVKAQ